MDKNLAELVGALMALSLFLGLFIGVTLGHYELRSQMQNEAVKVGVARWAADKDGAVEFKWNVPAEKGAEKGEKQQ